jgi:hypothetical protein
MKAFVFWTGITNLFAGVAFQFPAFSALILPSEQPGVYMHLFGLLVIFLGTTLVFCSRDLTHRGTLVVWEGILRVGGFAVFAGYGVFGRRGIPAFLSGLFDLSIGLTYLILLPRSLSSPLADLLLDRNAARKLTPR